MQNDYDECVSMRMKHITQTPHSLYEDHMSPLKETHIKETQCEDDRFSLKRHM